MLSSRRGLIGLTLLVVGLGLIAWFEPGLEPPPTPELQRLSTLDSNTIDRLSLERGDFRITFKRKAGEWWLDDLPANRFRLDKLLGLPGTVERDRFPLGNADLNAFGLAPPMARLGYGDALTIEVGGESPLGDARYLRIGETIHLIDNSFHFYLLGERERFIAPAPLPPGAKLVGIATEQWTLRQIDGRWHSEPEHLIQSADQAVALFDSWRHAQALQLTLLDELETFDESIRLELEGGRELRFDLQRGERHWRLIRTDARLEYLLDAEAAAKLIQPAEISE